MHFIKNDIWKQILKAKRCVEILETCTQSTEKNREYKEILKAFEMAEERHKRDIKKVCDFMKKKRIINKNYARGKSLYSSKKEHARRLAIFWQQNFNKECHSWQWCMKWQNIFERIALKYGLQKEFKANGIL